MKFLWLPELYLRQQRLNGSPSSSTVLDSVVCWAIHHYGIKVERSAPTAVVKSFLLEVFLLSIYYIVENNVHT